MVKIVKTTILIICVKIQFFNCFSQNISEKNDFYNKNAVFFENRVYKNSIKTVLMYKEGWQLSYPVLKLNSKDILTITFDELGEEFEDYSFTIIHCNADWQKSDLFYYEYIEGYEEVEVDDYELSINTLVNYVHYRFSFPNDDMKPLLSGNYVLKAYKTDNRDSVIFTRRMVVYDDLLSIDAQIKRPARVDLMYEGQNVQFSIDCSSYSVTNPSEDFIVYILQNYRWDNAKKHVKPRYIAEDILHFDHDDITVFNGGNEFRYVDLKNYKFKAIGIDSIYTDAAHRYHYQLYRAERRNFKAYSFHEDLNGRRLIKREMSEISDVEADYFYVHFSLPYLQPERNGNFYVFGAFCDWKFNKANMLNYNYNLQQYETTLLLKQGYYNYEYVFVEDRKNFADNSVIEGSFYQTENDYLIFVYHRDVSNRYDKLVGVKILNSVKKL